MDLEGLYFSLLLRLSLLASVRLCYRRCRCHRCSSLVFRCDRGSVFARAADGSLDHLIKLLEVGGLCRKALRQHLKGHLDFVKLPFRLFLRWVLCACLFFFHLGLFLLVTWSPLFSFLAAVFSGFAFLLEED